MSQLTSNVFASVVILAFTTASTSAAPPQNFDAVDFEGKPVVQFYETLVRHGFEPNFSHVPGKQAAGPLMDSGVQKFGWSSGR